jgi:hypothetical protein
MYLSNYTGKRSITGTNLTRIKAGYFQRKLIQTLLLKIQITILMAVVVKASHHTILILSLFKLA